MRGNVKRKYFSLELKCAEDWFSAFSPLPRAVPVRGDEIPRDVFRSPKRIMLISPPGAATSWPTIGR